MNHTLTCMKRRVANVTLPRWLAIIGFIRRPAITNVRRRSSIRTVHHDCAGCVYGLDTSIEVRLSAKTVTHFEYTKGTCIVPTDAQIKAAKYDV